MKDTHFWIRWYIYILLKWQWSPAENHQGPENKITDGIDLSICVCVCMLLCLIIKVCVCFYFVSVEIREPPDTDRGIVSSTNLSQVTFSSVFLSIYIAKMWSFLRARFLAFFCFHWINSWLISPAVVPTPNTSYNNS